MTNMWFAVWKSNLKSVFNISPVASETFSTPILFIFCRLLTRHACRNGNTKVKGTYGAQCHMSSAHIGQRSFLLLPSLFWLRKGPSESLVPCEVRKGLARVGRTVVRYGMIRRIPSPSLPYHPMSNGHSKVIVGVAKKILKKAKESKQGPYLLILEYRHSPLPDCNLSPAQLLLCRQGQ